MIITTLYAKTKGYDEHITKLVKEFAEGVHAGIKAEEA